MRIKQSLWLAVAAAAVLILITAQPPLARAQGRGRGTPAVTGPWMNTALSPDQRADLLLGQMTLEEKLQLLHGMGGFGRGGGGATPPPTVAELERRLTASRNNGGAGFIPGIPRLGIPDLQMADAAVGVTRGAARGRYSTALPSDIALASSWDLKAAYDYGALIGTELRDEGYTMSLGGGVDITREPRNGRNFEYLGEDPILAGWLDGEAMRGLQAQGILGDVKHYAFNDQETGRTVLNVVMPDQRVMRETDLLAFEIAVKDAQPAAVMCAYNKVNGDYACENRYLLTDVLKDSIGFKGFVLSDWGATHSTVKAALAGLDIEMPGDSHFGAPLQQAVAAGEVPMGRIDDMVHRILRSEFAVGLMDRRRTTEVPDAAAGMAVARRIADESMVLLKNAGAQLPLSPAVRSIAVIGSHADAGVLSGGGSAQVNAPGGNAVAASGGRGRGRGGPVYFRSSPLAAIRAAAPGARVSYNDGSDLAAAAALAQASQVAIVFCNQPMSEGRDAASLALPGNQDALVAAVTAANPHTVVVLETGGAVAMPWAGRASAILEAWYPGIRGGEAIADILFGRVNPSAKTPITFAASDADLPHPVRFGPPAAPASVGGRRGQMPSFDVVYSEGLEVGYKWYDAQHKQPLFPFGYGLTYTTFAYSGLKVTQAGGALAVHFELKNTGKRAGTEIAEVYLAFPASAGEPPKRLVGWDRVELAAGESKALTVPVALLRLSVWDTSRNAWRVLPGDYRILVGGSSRSLPLSSSLTLAGTPR
ncbi:MAG: beta-glucosidase family protein [Terriglobales bacterium]